MWSNTLNSAWVRVLYVQWCILSALRLWKKLSATAQAPSARFVAHATDHYCVVSTCVDNPLMHTRRLDRSGPSRGRSFSTKKLSRNASTDQTFRLGSHTRDFLRFVKNPAVTTSLTSASICIYLRQKENIYFERRSNLFLSFPPSRKITPQFDQQAQETSQELRILSVTFHPP